MPEEENVLSYTENDGVYTFDGGEKYKKLRLEFKRLRRDRGGKVYGTVVLLSDGAVLGLDDGDLEGGPVRARLARAGAQRDSGDTVVIENLSDRCRFRAPKGEFRPRRPHQTGVAAPCELPEEGAPAWYRGCGGPV